jgi:hypothetical protein
VQGLQDYLHGDDLTEYMNNIAQFGATSSTPDGGTQSASTTASNDQSKPKTNTTSATSNPVALVTKPGASKKSYSSSVYGYTDGGGTQKGAKEALENADAQTQADQASSAVNANLATAQQAANVVSGAAASGRGSLGSSNPNQAYIDQLNSIYQQIMDRGPWDKEFQYDLNGDALYKQYADQYARMGQQAMQDTVAEASALTGGYGNSWAATAGSQAYQDYLGQLNSIVPTLQQQAYDQYLADYDRWNDETNRLLTLYDLTAAHPSVVSSLKPSYGGSSTVNGADAATSAAMDAIRSGMYHTAYNASYLQKLLASLTPAEQVTYDKKLMNKLQPK